MAPTAATSKMDRCFFLIIADSKILDEDSVSHQLLHGLCSAHANTVIYLILPDFQDLVHFRTYHSQINCLLLDVKNDWVADPLFFANLPEMDCVVDFTGELLQKFGSKLTISSSVPLKKKHIDIPTINKHMKANTGNAAILIYAQTKGNQGNFAKAACISVTKKLKDSLVSSSDEQIQFQPNRKFLNQASSSSALTQQPSRFRNRRNDEETQPLLSRDNIDEQVDIPTFSGIIASTLSQACCCFSLCRTAELRFENQEQLQNYLRGQWHDNLKQNLVTWFEEIEEDLKNKMEDIDKEISLQLEREWRAKCDDEKERQRKLQEVEDKIKKTDYSTRDDIFQKIDESHKKDAIRKVGWAERDFRRTVEEIKGAFESNRDSVRQEHYLDSVYAEIQVLKCAQRKFEKMKSDLLQAHFGNS